MADRSEPKPADTVRRVSAQGRQDGDYEVELTGAKGGPIPEFRPFADEQPSKEPPASA